MGQPKYWANCTLLAFLVVGVLPAPALQPAETDLRRIRTSNPAVARLLAEGIARSPTFSVLVGRLERTRWLVFIERGQCPVVTAGACLLNFVGSYSTGLYVRILINERRVGHPNRQINTMAHELQHALEVAESGEVVDAATLVALFRRIGYVTQQSRRGIAYETDAARHLGEQVLKELGAHKRPSP